MILGINCGYCDRTLFLLLRTFLEIVALRKGPDQVPSSSLLLMVSVVMTLVAAFCAIALIGLDRKDLLLILITNVLILVFYLGVLVVAGYARRAVQTLTCLLGCGALLAMLSLGEYVMFRPFLGDNLAGTLAALITFWSIPVEGHIVSRAIRQQWFVGIAIALAATVLQFALQTMLAGPITGNR